MLRRLLFIIMVLVALSAHAQQPFKGLFTNKDLNLRLRLNLYSRDIPVPGLELDSCYGHLTGSVNGMWVVLRVKRLDESQALVRVASERGSDAQDLLIDVTDAGISVRQHGDTYIKGVKNRKYVKLPKTILLNREEGRE